MANWDTHLVRHRKSVVRQAAPCLRHVVGKKKRKKKKGIYAKTVRQLIISPPILRPGLLPLLYMLHAPGTTAVAAQQYRYVVPVRDWVEYKYMMLCS